MTSTRARRPDTLLTAPFVLLWLTGAFLQMSFGLMVHLPGYLSDLGATESVIGLIYAAGAAAVLAMSPLTGRILDSYGRKRVLLVVGLLLVVASAAFLPLDAIGVPAFVTRIFYATSEVLVFTTLLAFGADLSPASRRVQGLAVLGISGLIPIGLGAISGDLVSAAGSYERVFVLATGLALLGWVLAWWLPDLPPAKAAGTPHAGFFRVATRRNLLPVWLLTAGFVVGMMSLFTYMRTYVDASGRGSVGLYFGVYAGAAVAVRVFVRAGSDRRSLLVLAVPAMACVAGQYVLLGVTASVPAMVLAAALGGFGHGLLFPALTTLVVTRTSTAERGTALAAFSALFDAGTLVASPLVGRSIEALGYQPTFEIVSIVVLACLAGFLIWDGAVARST